MASHDTYIAPLSFFSPPGSIAISPAAMELARQFLTAAINAAPDKKWVAVFEWADSRRVRDKGDGQWSDFGPGLDLCAYEAGHLPEGVAAEQDGAMIALKIPGHIARAAVQKLIDVGAAPATRVTLL